MPILKIKDYIFGGVVIALLVAIAWITISKNWEIGSLTTNNAALTVRVEQLNRDLGTCQANRISLQGSLDEQNAAIQRLRATTQAREQELAVIATNAQRDAQNASERARRILASPGSTCADADRIILENLE